jgi:hypothetical protein
MNATRSTKIPSLSHERRRERDITRYSPVVGATGFTGNPATPSRGKSQSSRGAPRWASVEEPLMGTVTLEGEDCAGGSEAAPFLSRNLVVCASRDEDACDEGAGEGEGEDGKDEVEGVRPSPLCSPSSVVRLAPRLAGPLFGAVSLDKTLDPPGATPSKARSNTPDRPSEGAIRE